MGMGWDGMGFMSPSHPNHPMAPRLWDTRNAPKTSSASPPHLQSARAGAVPSWRARRGETAPRYQNHPRNF